MPDGKLHSLISYFGGNCPGLPRFAKMARWPATFFALLMIKGLLGLSTLEAYLGINNALREFQGDGGTRYPGALAGVVVLNDVEKGLVILTSQDKWDQRKGIITKWLERVEVGDESVDHIIGMLLDRGFVIYVTQACHLLTPYMEGVHLTLETWRGNRDSEGWKLLPEKSPPPSPQDPLPNSVKSSTKVKEFEDWEDVELNDDWEMVEDTIMVLEQKEDVDPTARPSSVCMDIMPRLKSDLQVLAKLTQPEKPSLRVTRGKVSITAYYGFEDASSGGFRATIERTGGTHSRFGLWGRDAEDASSNYRELRNLVEWWKEKLK